MMSITSEDCYLSCSNEHVVANRGEEVSARYLLLHPKEIVPFSFSSAHPR